MKLCLFQHRRVLLFSFWMFPFIQSIAQQESVKDLDFLIGTWQTEEHNKAGDWWEKSTRTGIFILDEQYIQLESVAVSSTGKKRTYRFLIHYDSQSKQFEMISIYGNYPKSRTEIMEWDKNNRKLTLKSKPSEDEYSDRAGVIQFNDDFTEYIWTGSNKSGDPQKPRIFEYEEVGKKN
jgi:hypothetical protein